MIRSISCKECGNDFWEVCGDTADCTNCGFERKFHSRQARTDKISRAQEEAIELIREVVLENDGLHSEDYEFKKFEVQLLDWGSVQVLTEVGSKTDEGTLAAILCRTKRQIFIRRRGGLTLLNPAKFVKNKQGRTKRTFKKGNIKGLDALRHPTI